MRFKVQKTHYFPHTVHYCCSSVLRLSEMRRFLQSSSFWEARCALIGQLSSALWLAEYLKRVTEMLRPLPYCDAVSRCDDTKTIKPIINETFVASSGDIITDYNDLYCLFTCCVASRRVNITMSAFVSQKHQTVLAKLELPHFIETAFVHSWQATPRFRKQSSVKCAAHTLIFGLNCSGTVL